jgi:ubiquinone biosynthesis monooxygenase Coq7
MFLYSPLSERASYERFVFALALGYNRDWENRTFDGKSIMTQKLSPSTQSMIRVNHAGEYGAARIYAGQLFVLGADQTIEHMAAQEAEHLDAFQQMLINERVRPSVLQPVWYAGGFLMGALTALAGRNIAHACTSAVETVIDEHYRDQLDQLRTAEGENPLHASLATLVEQCRQDECAHKETANVEAGVDLAKAYPITTGIIETITRSAIAVAKRF